MIAIKKLLKNEEMFPLVKETGDNLFINPQALGYLAAAKVRGGEFATIEKALNSFTYDDGETPLTPSLKAVIQKETVSLLQNYYSRQFNEREADTYINKVMGHYDLIGMIPRIGVKKVDYNIRYNVYGMGSLYDSVRAGENPTARAGMPAKVAKYGKLKRFMQRWEIRDTELEQYLYNQDMYLNEVAEAKLEEWWTRLNEIATVGDFNDSYGITSSDLLLMNGVETILKEQTGVYTNSDSGVETNAKMFKKWLKPETLDYNKINSLTTTNRVGYTYQLTAAQIAKTFDAIIARTRIDERNKKLFNDKRKYKFYVDSYTKLIYDEGRVDAIGYDASRTGSVSGQSYTGVQESYKQDGGFFRHKGYEIVELTHASGTMIMFGDIEQFRLYYQYEMQEVSEYNMELSNGDSGFTFKRKGHMNLDIADAERFIIARGVAGGDVKAGTPEVVTGEYGINGTALASGGASAATVESITFYPYAVDKGVKLYYTEDGSTPDATDTLIAEGSGITIAQEANSGDNVVLKIVAVKDGVANSDLYSYTVTKAAA